jgi:chitodextrinase
MAPFGPPYDLTATAIGPLEVELAWTNAGYHDSTRIERKIVGGQYSEIVSVGGYDTSYRDGSVADGTAYVYRARAETGGEYTEYSNEAEVTSALPAPTGLQGYARPTDGVEGEPMTEAVLSWVDNSQNEESFHIYRGETLIEETAANATGFTVTGLTPNARYKFGVRAFKSPAYSPWSNLIWVTMGDPPNAPSELTATPVGIVGIAEIQLNWTENSDNEIDFHIELSTTEPDPEFPDLGFAEINGDCTVGANITFYRVLDLIPGTQYWFRVRAHNESGYSEYSNVATATTKDAIAAPTNLVCTPAKVEGLYGVECVFDDNSFAEDSHTIQRKIGAGAWDTDFAVLAPNQTYFHDSFAFAGTTYTYRVFATKDEVNTPFSNEVMIIVPGVPPAITDLAVSEYQDTWARLIWWPLIEEVGYSIELSTTSDSAGFAEIMRICPRTPSESFFSSLSPLTMKIPGLTASIQYWFRILAYNGAGDSDYSNVVTVTTRALYLPSRFEKLIKKSNPLLVFLVEANPLMDLTGWTLKPDKIYTYETEFDEDGAPLVVVYENGVALRAKTSAEYDMFGLEATPGYYYYDIANKKVYIHTTTGIDPANFLITGSLLLCFTTWQRGSTVYNGNNYLPLVAKDGIPDISQTIQPFYKGTFAVSSGTLNLINGKVRKAFHFDQRFARYIWLNQKIKILAGGEGFTYSEFVPVHTGSINSVSISDRRMSLDLRDFRDGLRRDLPVEKYSLDTFPLMDENRAGTERPFGFGAITNAVAVCIDMESRRFEFQNGRVDSIYAYKNDVAMSPGTDYFIDYQRGRVTLARDLPYDATADRVIVDFRGDVNTAGEANVSGAEIFLDICRKWMGCQIEDMDFDAIYATKIAKPTALSLYLHKTQDSGDAVHVIEQTIQSYTMQDGAGRLGIRAEQTTPASGAPYVWNVHVFDFEAIKNQDPLFSEIKISYAENPASDFYFHNQIIRPPITWRQRINKSLDICIASADLEIAFEAALAIADQMERQQISFTIPRVLYTCLPGDIIYFNRTRFPSLTGTAVNLPIKLLGISKLISSGKTAITAEVI